jgi:ZPR1 zinc-finger domain
MRTFRRAALLSILVFAGLLLSSSHARAFWPKTVVRYKYVSRGGWGSPGMGIVPVGGGSGEVASLGWSGAEIAPLGFNYYYRGSTSSDLNDRVNKLESAMLSKPEVGNLSKGSGGGTTTPPPADTTCKDLSARMEKIEGRLTTLEASVTKLQTKVDQLYDAEMQKRQTEDDAKRTQAIIQVVTKSVMDQNTANFAKLSMQLADQNKAQATILAQLFAEQRKAMPDQKVIDDLLKKLANPAP